MYLISSWRWLTDHSRAITSCCLSEPVLCTTPYTLGPWCCSEVSGTPLVMAGRCWGRQDRPGQVSVACLLWGSLSLSLCLCICMRCVCTCTHALAGKSSKSVCVCMHPCTCLYVCTCLGICSTAAEHSKQEVGNQQLKKSAGCIEGVKFLQPSTWAAADFCLLYLSQLDSQWKQMPCTGAATTQ